MAFCVVCQWERRQSILPSAMVGRKKNKGMKIFYDILEKEPSPDINEGLS